MSVADAIENTNTYGIIRAYRDQWQVAGQLTLDQHIGHRLVGVQMDLSSGCVVFDLLDSKSKLGRKQGRG
jgi:hypothetical protein